MIRPLLLRAPLAALPLLAGCGGGVVQVDDHPFGALRSAVWFEVKLDGVATRHQFVAADVGNLCDRTQVAADALGRALTDFEQDVEDAEGDADALCAARSRFWEASWQATRQLYKRNGSFLTLTFDDREDDLDDPPEINGTYEVDDLDDPTFEGQLLSIEDNPFRRLRREGDCTDPLAAETLLDELVTTWTISEGTAEVERRNNERFRIEMDARLENARGDDRGDASLRGRFDLCPLRLTPNGAAGLWYLLPVVLP